MAPQGLALGGCGFCLPYLLIAHEMLCILLESC